MMRRRSAPPKIAFYTTPYLDRRYVQAQAWRKLT